MIQRGKDGAISRRPLKECEYSDCDQGLVISMFGNAYDCTTCNGFGYVDAETGEALPDREIIRQQAIQLRLERQRFSEYSEGVQKQLERLRDYERSR